MRYVLSLFLLLLGCQTIVSAGEATITPQQVTVDLLMEKAETGDQEAQTMLLDKMKRGEKGFEVPRRQLAGQSDDDYARYVRTQETLHNAVFEQMKHWRHTNPGVNLIFHETIISPRNGFLGLWPNNVEAYKDLLHFHKLIVQAKDQKDDFKQRVLTLLFTAKQMPLFKQTALAWKDASEVARRIILEGIFEDAYSGIFVSLQGQALVLLKEFALKGSGKAFDILRTKISIPQVHQIATNRAVITAANTHKIDSATGGWEAFLNSRL